LLDTTRAYALEKLAQSGDLERLERRHAEHFRDIFERTYGHHDPDYMRVAANAITAKQPRNVLLVVSWVEPEKRSQRNQKT
jgi:predicted ATPase